MQLFSIIYSKLIVKIWTEIIVQGFPQVLRTWGGVLQNLIGEWGLKSVHGESMWGLKVQLKNTCEGVHLIVKLWAISLQAFKFTKNELFYKFFKDFSQILSSYLLCFF